MIMQSMFKWLLLVTLSFIATSCVTLNLDDGIANFRAENYRHAFIKLKPEADKGQPDAEYAVAYMYYYGLGVTENRKQAWLWMNRAARAGQVQAITAIKLLTRPHPKQSNYGPDIDGT